MKKSLFLALGLLVVGIGTAVWVAELKAASVTVTFTMTRVKELQCDEGAGEACPNDFYSQVEIDGQGVDRNDWCHNSCSDDFQPNWVFTRSVDDTTHSPVGIHVELWDQDDLSGDDQIDINAEGPKTLDIQLNLDTCTWQGGGLKGFINTQSTSSGTGDDSAQIYFTISTSAPGCRDSDGDGLLDAWETNGFDADGDGIIDVNLPAMGANPNRKDLFLEIDYLNAANHTHAPLQAAIQQVVQGFANAPVANPDGTTGIQLHVDVGSLYGVGSVTNVAGTGGVTGTLGDYGGGGTAIAEAGNTIVDYDGNTGNPATNFFAIKALNPNRDAIFRYVIFAHQTNQRAAANDCTSGVAKGIPGVNFIVSLGGVNSKGNPCWGTDALGQSVGTQAQQAGTLMHEYGHTLGLLHGGGDGLNNKPNYLSVMNYSFQQCAVTAVPVAGIPGGCDYSRFQLPPAVGLNENSLDECKGIDGGALGLGPVDFNADKTLEGASNCQPPSSGNVAANVNGDYTDTDKNGTQDPGEPSTLGTLNGFQDWNAVVYNHRLAFDYQTAGAPSPDEPDPDTIANARAYIAKLLHAALSLDKTGPADARPGDSLSYNVRIDNTTANSGTGPAVNVTMTDTRPDLTSVSWNIGIVALGATINNGSSYLVPCSAPDRTILTNSASASGTDLLGDSVTSADSVSTTIHTPVLTLSKTATPSVNAGEAISYTITYANTGSGAASNVTVTDTIPADIYYSMALDQGAGPKPSTVTLNGNGSRTLVWNIGALAGSSGPQTLGFTARPTLLALGGTTYTNNASLTFTNGTSCVFSGLTASAATSISIAATTRDPLSMGYWRAHPEALTVEILARIQATDQRYDAAPVDGLLAASETSTAFKPGGTSPYVLSEQLLAIYINLATRRVNAETGIRSKIDTALGLTNVGDAARYANATLLAPYTEATSARYSNATTALDEINTNKSPR
jgi:uncharacterized repeat protein (TIGR01451 family)